MALSPQSIRKGTIVLFDGTIVEKQVILEVSKSWEPKHEIMFKKLLKQGGSFRANGTIIRVLPPDQILTSRGERDGGIQQTDPFARF
jgi:hypothetical protein